MPILEDLLTLTTHELFSGVFLPFIIIFAIFFGALSALRIFSRKINIVLSLALTVAAGYGGVFTWFSSFIMPFGAYFGVIAFVIVFIVGIAMWGLGRGKEIYYENLAPEEKLKKIDKDIAKLEKKIDDARNKGDRDKEEALWRTWDSLQRERRMTERELRR